jgi:predicted signal transduction protein with EAL and GGDEF domain
MFADYDAASAISFGCYEAILNAFNDTGANLPAGVTIGTSIGIAVFPNDAADRETLLSHADAALYEAKMQGRGVYCVFEPFMGEHQRDRRQFEHDIRHAISRRELRLVYQPQAELLSNKVFGFERCSGGIIRIAAPFRRRCSSRSRRNVAPF